MKTGTLQGFHLASEHHPPAGRISLADIKEKWFRTDMRMDGKKNGKPNNKVKIIKIMV